MERTKYIGKKIIFCLTIEKGKWNVSQTWYVIQAACFIWLSYLVYFLFMHALRQCLAVYVTYHLRHFLSTSNLNLHAQPSFPSIFIWLVLLTYFAKKCKKKYGSSTSKKHQHTCYITFGIVFSSYFNKRKWRRNKIKNNPIQHEITNRIIIIRSSKHTHHKMPLLIATIRLR
jgi:hypothetical protein